MEMSDVFISYSRKDAAFVRRLNEALTKAGKNVWVDWMDIPYSAKWWDEIYTAIESTTTFLCILSPDYFISKTCIEEAGVAEKLGKRIIPIVHRNFDEKLNTSNSIAKINWLPFRDTDDFSQSFSSLISTLNTDLEWVKFHTRLLMRANEWAAKKNDSSYHLYGKDLEDALKEKEHNGSPPLNTLQNNYIASSQSGAAKQQQKQLRGFYIVALIYSVAQMFVIYIWGESDLSETAMIKLSWVWLPALSFGVAGFIIGKHSMKKSLIAMGIVMILFYLFYQFLWAAL
ncbi:MAG: toll/interleukin-1 receptor domain-containing protein [Agriterribacter sp.]